MKDGEMDQVQQWIHLHERDATAELEAQVFLTDVEFAAALHYFHNSSEWIRQAPEFREDTFPGGTTRVSHWTAPIQRTVSMSKEPIGDSLNLVQGGRVVKVRCKREVVHEAHESSHYQQSLRHIKQTRRSIERETFRHPQQWLEVSFSNVQQQLAGDSQPTLFHEVEVEWTFPRLQAMQHVEPTAFATTQMTIEQRAWIFATSAFNMYAVSQNQTTAAERQ